MYAVSQTAFQMYLEAVNHEPKLKGKANFVHFHTRVNEKAT